MMDKRIRAVVAEFIATALFVWIGCGSAVAAIYNRNSGENDSALIVIASGFGFAIAVLAYAIGHISGGHMNPAVTLSFLVLRIQEPIQCLFYIIAQCLGAIFGSILLWGCVASLDSVCQDHDHYKACTVKDDGSAGPYLGLGANGFNNGVSTGSAFLLEAIGTYLLVFTVLHSAVHKKSNAENAAPIAIGWSVFLAHLVLVPFTGCGINPARTLGPFVVNSFVGVSFWRKGTWVYFIAPLVGSLMASATYNFIFDDRDKKETEGMVNVQKESEGAEA